MVSEWAHCLDLPVEFKKHVSGCVDSTLSLPLRVAFPVKVLVHALYLGGMCQVNSRAGVTLLFLLLALIQGSGQINQTLMSSQQIRWMLKLQRWMMWPSWLICGMTVSGNSLCYQDSIFQMRFLIIFENFL